MDRGIFGTRLREARLTQKELSEVLVVCKSWEISQWETGKKEPSFSILRLLCYIFNRSADYLIGLTDS